MTTTATVTVDTSLAPFDVPTLMTKAFELTHRLDALAQYNGTPQGARAIGEVRDQRDAIVREMQRRADGMERALVMVEATERLMRGVDEELADVVAGTGDPEVHAQVTRVRKVLDATMERTTTLTCSLVKDMTLSDSIAAKAREIVRPIVEATRA